MDIDSNCPHLLGTFQYFQPKKNTKKILNEKELFFSTKKKIFFPRFFFSRNVNSIKCEKNIKTLHPPPQTTPTFEIQNQNKGIEDIMDIDSNCPHLLFGETTSHLTSKWRGTFNIIIFNVENSIKLEMRKNCFSKKKYFSTQPPPPPSPPPEIFFDTNFFLKCWK